MAEVLQLVGAALILGAFVPVQLRLRSTSSPTVAALNLVGSILLAIAAAMNSQLGFLVLEICWAIATVWSVATLLAARRRGPGATSVS
jgi:hypothetical protein